MNVGMLAMNTSALLASGHAERFARHVMGRPIIGDHTPSLV
jgi:hypothetical protein